MVALGVDGYLGSTKKLGFAPTSRHVSSFDFGIIVFTFKVGLKNPNAQCGEKLNY